MTDFSPENPPAFPYSQIDLPGAHESNPGMSLRDYFAGQALVGTLATGAAKWPREIAHAAYQQADAMLAERAKESGK